MTDKPLNLRQCLLCGEQKAIRFLYYKNSYSIVKCESCSLVYTNEIPSQSELNNIYSKEFFNVGSKFEERSSSAGHINAAKRVQQLLKLTNIKQKKWLDVGCATGDYMIAAKPFVDEIHGIEISKYAASLAKMRGLHNITVGDFLLLEMKPEEFDLVSMWDIIEHVRDPVAALKQAMYVLRHGGYLAVTTGDIDSKIARLTGRFWHLMIPPKHLYFFSAETIGRMLMDVGFHLISIKYSGKHVPLDFVLWKFFNIIFSKSSDRALRLSRLFRLEKAAPVINFNDIMTIYAQKP